MAIQSSVLAWRIPRTKEPGGLQSIDLQKVRHNWSNWLCMHATGRGSWVWLGAVEPQMVALFISSYPPTASQYYLPFTFSPAPCVSRFMWCFFFFSFLLREHCLMWISVTFMGIIWSSSIHLFQQAKLCSPMDCSPTKCWPIWHQGCTTYLRLWCSLFELLIFFLCRC